MLALLPLPPPPNNNNKNNPPATATGHHHHHHLHHLPRRWRLLTCAFTHNGLLHLLINCVSIHFICPSVEGASGRVRFLGLYLGSALAGGLASYYTHSLYHAAAGSSGERGLGAASGWQCCAWHGGAWRAVWCVVHAAQCRSVGATGG
jgi:membrane associated rhomboid family serine protease